MLERQTVMDTEMSKTPGNVSKGANISEAQSLNNTPASLLPYPSFLQYTSLLYVLNFFMLRDTLPFSICPSQGHCANQICG